MYARHNILQQIKGMATDIVEKEAMDDDQGSRQMGEVNLIAVDDKPTEERTVSQRNISQRALADAVVREKRVRHVVEMGAFMVEGSRGDKNAVSLYPKEKCQCPSTGTCYHILTARISSGLPTRDEKRTFILSQLKRNSRKRVYKKGRGGG